MRKLVSKIVRSMLWVFLCLLIVLVVLYFLPPDPVQELIPTIGSKSAGLVPGNFDMDSLYILYGQNKTLAPGFELQCLLALSAYPELKHSRVRFLLKERGAPMESSFGLFSLLGNENSRTYHILLNNSQKPSFLEPILLRNLPFDAQIGILVHELGHTYYYHNLNVFEIISWAMNYGLRPSYRAAHERSTDALAVYRGMGWQMLNYAEFVRYDSSTRELYFNGKVFMDTFYMTPREIERTMKESGLY